MYFIIYFLMLHIAELSRADVEVLQTYRPTRPTISPHHLLIIQYDDRPLDDYWKASATWNQHYAMSHGHKYMYLSLHPDSGEPLRKPRCSYASIDLAPAWCKVRAMIESDNIAGSDIKAILYLDSDAIVTVNYSMTHVLAFIQSDLNWSFNEKPFAFNQDGPGWACKQTMKYFDYCLNSGTVFWIRTPTSSQILLDWWNSAGEPYNSNPFPMKWRYRWPWEQAQMYSIYDKYKSKIMRLSFPSLPFLPWTSELNPKAQYPTDKVKPWCFSHWPGADCFITHHCASRKQKAKLLNYESYLLNQSINVSINVHYFKV